MTRRIMTRFSLALGLLLLALPSLLLAQQEKTKVEVARHTFKPPFYLVRGSSLPYWDFGGSTVVTEEYVRLTPAVKSRVGWIWNAEPVRVPNWEVVLSFRISGGKNVGADGFAFWAIDKPGISGPVFGNHDRWNGLGIIFDSFDNDNKKDNPYISAILNHGQLSYNSQTDGRELQLGGCRAFYRNPAGGRVSKARITYNNGLLDLAVDATGSGSFEPCITAVQVALPETYFFGLTAETGELVDNHDIISFITYDLSPEVTAAAYAKAGGPMQRNVREAANTQPLAAQQETATQFQQQQQQQQQQQHQQPQQLQQQQQQPQQQQQQQQQQQHAPQYLQQQPPQYQQQPQQYMQQQPQYQQPQYVQPQGQQQPPLEPVLPLFQKIRQQVTTPPQYNDPEQPNPRFDSIRNKLNSLQSEWQHEEPVLATGPPVSLPSDEDLEAGRWALAFKALQQQSEQTGELVRAIIQKEVHEDIERLRDQQKAFAEALQQILDTLVPRADFVAGMQRWEQRSNAFDEMLDVTMRELSAPLQEVRSEVKDLRVGLVDAQTKLEQVLAQSADLTSVARSMAATNANTARGGAGAIDPKQFAELQTAVQTIKKSVEESARNYRELLLKLETMTSDWERTLNTNTSFGFWTYFMFFQALFGVAFVWWKKTKDEASKKFM